MLAEVPENVFDSLEAYYSFHPSGSLFAASVYNRVYIWDTQTGALLKMFVAQGVEHGVSFSPDGTLLVTGGNQLRFYAVVE